mmetsp:Transcript_16406/g.32078  ORF Transcript_16406/g.32078 Transcript_16406/m.32078 type:complete len:346 (+) Transcript_16406:177-1214(+)
MTSFFSPQCRRPRCATGRDEEETDKKAGFFGSFWRFLAHPGLEETEHRKHFIGKSNGKKNGKAEVQDTFTAPKPCTGNSLEEGPKPSEGDESATDETSRRYSTSCSYSLYDQAGPPTDQAGFNHFEDTGSENFADIPALPTSDLEGARSSPRKAARDDGGLQSDVSSESSEVFMDRESTIDEEAADIQPPKRKPRKQKRTTPTFSFVPLAHMVRVVNRCTGNSNRHGSDVDCYEGDLEESEDEGAAQSLRGHPTRKVRKNSGRRSLKQAREESKEDQTGQRPPCFRSCARPANIVSPSTSQIRTDDGHDSCSNVSGTDCDENEIVIGPEDYGQSRKCLLFDTIFV